jgi:methylenetetrahydrofolate--tRNA-(uracil-5-)-methyltransferase
VKAYAVVQLRRDNALGTLYNIVGFQTKMKYGAQTRCFPDDSRACRMRAFARLGGIHRNTFLNSPTLLDGQMRLRSGPISALPARSPASRAMSKAPPWAFWRAHGRGRDAGQPCPPPATTAMGALITTSPAGPRPRPSSR